MRARKPYIGQGCRCISAWRWWSRAHTSGCILPIFKSVCLWEHLWASACTGVCVRERKSDSMQLWQCLQWEGLRERLCCFKLVSLCRSTCSLRVHVSRRVLQVSCYGLCTPLPGSLWSLRFLICKMGTPGHWVPLWFWLPYSLSTTDLLSKHWPVLSAPINLTTPWGTYVYLWLVHIDAWQTHQHNIVIILQFKMFFKKLTTPWFLSLKPASPNLLSSY